MEQTPQMLRRWGHYRQSYTKREKDDWSSDFARAQAAAPPPPPPPEPLLVPPPKPPTLAPFPDKSEVFARLRAKLDHL